MFGEYAAGWYEVTVLDMVMMLMLAVVTAVRAVLYIVVVISGILRGGIMIMIVMTVFFVMMGMSSALDCVSQGGVRPVSHLHMCALGHVCNDVEWSRKCTLQHEQARQDKAICRPLAHGD